MRVQGGVVNVVEQSGRKASVKGYIEGRGHVLVNVGGHEKELSIVVTGLDGTELVELKQTVMLDEYRGLPERVSEGGGRERGRSQREGVEPEGEHLLLVTSVLLGK